MNIVETLLLALNSLKNNKMRSFLTMLGIIIGISAVITITTIGSTIESTISKEFQALGSNIVGIYEYYYDEDEGYSTYNDKMFDISPEVIELFESKNPGFHYIDSRSLSSKINIGTGTQTIDVTGDFFNYGHYQFSKPKILYGRELTREDLEKGKYVCIVNKDLAKKYFGGEKKAIGNTIEFKSDDLFTFNLMIVGVYELEGSLNNAVMDSFGSNYQLISSIEIPEKKIKDFISINGINNYASFYYDSSVNPEKAGEIVRNFFGKRIRDPHIELEVENPIEQINTFMGILTVITVAISIIAGIALIVGGVGVMNIMLVSVVERTKEIGIEKALGARNNDIRFQFLIEAVVICLVGCLIGIIIGLFNGLIITAVAEPLIKYATEVSIDIAYTPPWTAIIIGSVFSSLIGIFFGLYPANKAAKLNPIDALRYE